MDINNDINWIESDGVNLIRDIAQRKIFIEKNITGYTFEQYLEYVQKNFNPIELKRACCIIRGLWSVWYEKNKRILTLNDIQYIYLTKYQEAETNYNPYHNLKDLIYEVNSVRKTKMFVKVLSGYIARYINSIVDNEKAQN